MKIIEQGFEILHWPSYALPLIEEVGRTAYRSHDKMKEGSSENFVKGLLSKSPVHKSPLEFADVVIRAKVGRDVSHELVRHRISSYLQESQRYVRYNDGNMEFIRPEWSERFHEAFEVWKDQMNEAETQYAYMVEGLGLKAQQARVILPNSTATVICIKKNFVGWRETLALRITPNVYPEMRALMTGILIELHRRLPVMFDDLMEVADLSIPTAKLVECVIDDSIIE